ncbi:TetR/AcrR family transcriptional regulator [Novosphingobium sp.]|uniref:TetR/AcrR family transcriptional regulator n=1 Tax=Novosphingobium sp. TaxID=1874826 RepID=UPI0038B8D004
MTPSEQSEYKERLLNAASELIDAQGLEGLTAGKLASHVGLRRTVVHYHFGTMDHLLAALIRRSSAQMRRDVLDRLSPATIGEDLWVIYRRTLHATEAFRARALVSEVVGMAYREAVDDFVSAISALLEAGYRQRGLIPEIPPQTMAMVLLMAAQFAGVERALGRSDEIDDLEAYIKSLFAISGR